MLVQHGDLLGARQPPQQVIGAVGQRQARIQEGGQLCPGAQWHPRLSGGSGIEALRHFHRPAVLSRPIRGGAHPRRSPLERWLTRPRHAVLPLGVISDEFSVTSCPPFCPDVTSAQIRSASTTATCTPNQVAISTTPEHCPPQAGLAAGQPSTERTPDERLNQK